MKTFKAGQEITVDGRTYIVRRMLPCGVEVAFKDQPFRTEILRLT